MPEQSSMASRKPLLTDLAYRTVIRCPPPSTLRQQYTQGKGRSSIRQSGRARVPPEPPVPQRRGGLSRSFALPTTETRSANYGPTIDSPTGKLADKGLLLGTTYALLLISSQTSIRTGQRMRGNPT